MKSRPRTMEEVLAHPKVRPLMAEGEAERIMNSLGESDAAPTEPIYIRILAGMGAWFAALCIILFLVIASIIDSGAGAILCGAAMLGAGIALGRWSEAVFISQLSLALAIAGNALTLFGLAEQTGFNDFLVFVCAQGVICAAIYPLYPNPVYRFLAPISLVALCVVWIVEKEAFVWFHGLIAAETLLFGFLFLSKRRQRALDPLAYSAALMLPVAILVLNLTQVDLWRNDFNEPLWPSSLMLSFGLLFLYFHLAGGMRGLRHPWMIPTIAATLLLGVFTTPGILVAVGLLVMGYAFGDRILAAFAFLFLPLFLVVFYYALNIDLAAKSGVVAGSGVLLLAARKIADACRPKPALESGGPNRTGGAEP